MKKELGQFYTVNNPFTHHAFKEWIDLIPSEKKARVVEPFAGMNSICKMLKDIGYDFEWGCYDIAPPSENATPENVVHKQDTLKNFPVGYYLAITNPPYLARNSATRAGLRFPDIKYDDLYKASLEVMLDNTEYVAAIIPESFIGANLFHNRLCIYISLTQRMFDDTDHPVCLALFVPEADKRNWDLTENDFIVYSQDTKVGKYKDLLSGRPVPKSTDINWQFNDGKGSIAIRCIDATLQGRIGFFYGKFVPDARISKQSRTITKVSGLPDDIDLEDFLITCTEILEDYREETKDALLTAFKGLRKDGKYRRRLDYSTARNIMNLAVEKLREEEKNLNKAIDIYVQYLSKLSVG